MQRKYASVNGRRNSKLTIEGPKWLMKKPKISVDSVGVAEIPDAWSRMVEASAETSSGISSGSSVMASRFSKRSLGRIVVGLTIEEDIEFQRVEEITLA